jgi:hypothetical protein
MFQNTALSVGTEEGKKHAILETAMKDFKMKSYLSSTTNLRV